MSNTSALQPTAAQLSPGAKKALVRLALLDGMAPSTDGYAWCGPYGAVLVRKGFAVANGRDAMGFKCFAPTKLGKAEGLKLFGAAARSGV